MKRPLYIVSGDWHIDRSNTEQIIDLARQQVDYCVKNKIKNIIFVGDMFKQRKSQELIVLNTLLYILDLFKQNGITMYAIGGNHDKVNLSSADSYLDPFLSHESLFLCREATYFDFGFPNISLVVLIPFFEEELFIQKLNSLELPEDAKDVVLMMHQGVTGTKNNDGSEVNNSINQGLFKRFKKVFSGHYHNRSVVGKVNYIGSIAQNNFGEDIDKGFCVVYDDLSHEYIQTKFKKFLKHSVIVTGKSASEIEQEIMSLNDVNSNVRVEVVGDKSVLDSIQIDKLRSTGIDVRKKDQDIDLSIGMAMNDEVIEFDNEGIMVEFVKFCNENNLDNKIGMKYLKKKLNVTV